MFPAEGRRLDSPPDADHNGADHRPGETTAAASSSSSSSSPLPSLSLWSLIAPFDSGDAQLPFCRRHLWPLLDDWDAVQASAVNRATLRYFSLVPIVGCTFVGITQSDRAFARGYAALPLSDMHCWPAVPTAVGAAVR